MRRWTADDVPPLEGRVAVVTGAGSGLGYAAALVLARHGARVVATARSKARGEVAVAALRAGAPSAEVTLVLLDLADLREVDGGARRIAASTDGIDILVNNAGVMAVPRRLTTAQGFELQFGTNHLGHFALTGRLLPLLLARPGARVVTVSSVAHRRAALDFEDLDSVAHYAPWEAYGRSKLANVLFFLELERRAKAAGAALASVGAHPGLAATNLSVTGPRLGAPDAGRSRAAFGALVTSTGTKLLGQSADRGALPILYAATAEDVDGGDYVGPGGPGELRGWPRRGTVSARGRDAESARRLWELSEELTGVEFTALGGA